MSCDYFISGELIFDWSGVKDVGFKICFIFGQKKLLEQDINSQ